MLVAPRTSTRASELLTPCICTRNSVLIRLAASLSPSPLVLQRASICNSTKMLLPQKVLPFGELCQIITVMQQTVLCLTKNRLLVLSQILTVTPKCMHDAPLRFGQHKQGIAMPAALSSNHAAGLVPSEQ